MRYGALFAVGLVFSVSASLRADEQAKAIVEKGIAAHGGDAVLNKLKAQTWKAKGTLHQAAMLAYTADYAFAAPDRYRFVMNANFAGNKIQLQVITDGKQAWERSGFTLFEMPKQKLEEFKHTVYVMWLRSLTPLKEKAFTLAVLPDRKLGEQNVAAVKVTSPGRRDVTLFFDKGTGLLAGSETRVFDEFAKKEVTQQVAVEGYKEQDGRKYFTKLFVRHDGNLLIEEELSEQKSLEKLDDKLFQEPKAGTRQ